METEKKIKVGLGIMIFRDGKILLGKRLNSHGNGEYAFPGGGLEYMEGFEEGALREIDEETGLKVENVRFVLLANLKDYAPLHYVHIGLVADWGSGEAELKEPEKCESWGWYDLNNLPSPRFKTVDETIIAYKTGRNFFDK